MSSILTNNSAMVALQTLNSINKNLAMTQNEISTGKSIASAKDNSAIWAISQVMQSDVDGFDAISASLALGESTVAVGRNASEQVTELLGEIKGKIVASQEDNVDRAKLQDDLSSLRDQISGIVGAAQFNGQNLLSNAEGTAGEGTIDVLASLDRDSSGAVASNNITVAKQDLGQADAAAGTGAFAAGATLSTAGAIADGATEAYTITTANVDVGAAFQFDASLFGGSGDVLYVAREGDTATDVAAALVAATNVDRASEGATLSDYTVTAVGGTIEITNNTGAAGATLAAGDLEFKAQGTGAAANTVGGGLELLGDIDVSTEDGAAAALEAIEFLTQTAIGASAEFGTGEKRLEIQADFISNLTDSLTSGIGSLVDADMEQASARLQALQVQQQLGIQSLSIANQAPQNILSLFR